MTMIISEHGRFVELTRDGIKIACPSIGFEWTVNIAELFLTIDELLKPGVNKYRMMTHPYYRILQGKNEEEGFLDIEAFTLMSQGISALNKMKQMKYWANSAKQLGNGNLVERNSKQETDGKYSVAFSIKQ